MNRTKERVDLTYRLSIWVMHNGLIKVARTRDLENSSGLRVSRQGNING